MATPYSEIYDRFLSKISDFFISELNDDEMLEYCHNLMIAALANLDNIEHDLTQYDDLIAQFEEDLTNTEIEYIACSMASKWIEPQLNNTTLTAHYIGVKDEKFFSSANQINQLRGLRDDLTARVKKIRRDYNYSHSDYFGS